MYVHRSGEEEKQERPGCGLISDGNGRAKTREALDQASVRSFERRRRAIVAVVVATTAAALTVWDLIGDREYARAPD